MLKDIDIYPNCLKEDDMATDITYKDLLDAAKVGGPAALSSVTHLAPAGGGASLVAPAKYTVAGQQKATYVFERRAGEDGPVNTVTIDSRTSESNRIEAALHEAIEEGHPILSLMPRIFVHYDAGSREIVESDLELPHRAFDAHIRLALAPDTGEPFIQDPRYIAARDSSPANAWGLFGISPISVVCGVWDSTRKARQARFASCVTSEIIGILADQDSDPVELPSRRSGGRIDPIGASIMLEKSAAEDLAERAGLGKDKAAPEKKGGTVRGSKLLLGAIPPSVGGDALDGISVSDIVRSRVLSFSALRSLKFGKGAEGDQAIRALLAAIAISGMVRADADLNLRANAHLVEAEAPQTTLHRRFGEKDSINPLTFEQADKILEEAYSNARKAAGLDWNGNGIHVKGDPRIIDAVNEAIEED